MANIKDVAKRANVAPSTVSLVLNNTGYVSQKTREKVEEAMRELDYKPNELARNLSRNKTNIIGIIVPSLNHPFFSTFIRYAERHLYQLGYKTMVCGTANRDRVEHEFLDLLRSQVMDGIIMGAHSLDVEDYKRVNRPLVAIDRYIDEKIPIVSSNHQKGGEMAALKLIDNNCKNVVHIKGASIVKTPAHQYHESFKELLEKNNINVFEVEMDVNCFDSQDFLKVARELFECYPNVDAIFGSDLAMLACLQQAREYGYNIPKQLKLIAYDGTYITSMSEKRLTSIIQPIEQLAIKAATTIVDLIEGKELKSSRIMLDVQLCEGETTL